MNTWDSGTYIQEAYAVVYVFTAMQLHHKLIKHHCNNWVVQM